MTFSDILFTKKDGIACLTLNMPETRNAITRANTISEMTDVVKDINEDKSVKVLIVTGVDPAFSSGGNIKDMLNKKGMFNGAPIEIMNNYRHNVQKIPQLMRSVEVPTIAAVNGPAVGAGFDLTLMCDIRIASTKAKFGETFLNVGLIPGDGGAWFLPRAVGLAKACELTFTGDMIDAQTALEMKLVNDVVEHEKLMDRAYEMAEKISNKPGDALRMAKKLIYMGQRMSLDDILDQSAAYQAMCHHTEDHVEAVAAFLEKREPKFTGK